MRRLLKSTVVSAGLAIFSMLFGAGNLIFPLRVGLISGSNITWGLSGLLLTACFIPIIGLLGVILFNGDYRSFFDRVGKVPGSLLIFFCMAVIGPLIAMSRIVTLSYKTVLPFLPLDTPLIVFSILFCGLTFFATYKENKLIDLLGRFISPALLTSLLIILAKGLMHSQPLHEVTQSGPTIFWKSAVLGYQSLDLLGTIFFASIVLTILKNTMRNNDDYNIKTVAWTAMKSGLLG